MAGFPSDTGTHQMSLDEAWKKARRIAAVVKDNAANLRAKSLAGTMTSTDVLVAIRQNYAAYQDFQTLAAVQGLGAYAQQQVNDGTLDIPASFTAMMNALVAVTNWVMANFPKTPTTNELRAQTFKGDGSGLLDDVVFNVPANTAGLRTVLDTLIATID